MKKIMAGFFVVSFILLSGDLMAQKGKKGEFSVGGGSLFAESNSMAFGGLSLGYNSKFVGFELNGAALEGIVLLGANLVVGALQNTNYIPYVTGGLWVAPYGGVGVDVGGGIKIPLSETYAVRVEYRRYFIPGGDWGLNALIGGISVFF